MRKTAFKSSQLFSIFLVSKNEKLLAHKNNFGLTPYVERVTANSCSAVLNSTRPTGMRTFGLNYP